MTTALGTEFHSTGPETMLESPIDKSTAVARLGGDEGLFLDFIRSVLDDAPQMLEKIRSALAAGRTDDAHLAAHGLKGMLATLEARPAAAAAWDVEQFTRQGLIPEAAAAADRLATELERLAPAIETVEVESRR